MRCPECGFGEILAAVRVRHGWTNASGGEVHGVREVLVCARCDADSPLAAYFAAHPTVALDAAPELAQLLGGWISQARAPELDEAALAAEIEAWRRGAL